MSTESNYDSVKKAFSDIATSFASDIDKELNRIGDLMQQKASSAAPVDTGYLAAHIEKSQTGQGSVTVTAIAEYSGYVDQGTVKMAANPFFTNSVKEIEETEIPKIEKNLQAKIDTKLNIVRG